MHSQIRMTASCRHQPFHVLHCCTNNLNIILSFSPCMKHCKAVRDPQLGDRKQQHGRPSPPLCAMMLCPRRQQAQRGACKAGAPSPTLLRSRLSLPRGRWTPPPQGHLHLPSAWGAGLPAARRAYSFNSCCLSFLSSVPDAFVFITTIKQGFTRGTKAVCRHPVLVEGWGDGQRGARMQYSAVHAGGVQCTAKLTSHPPSPAG